MKDIELIINKPHALRLQNKLTTISFTFVMWMIIFYLWQPLISLIAWSFGFKVFYEHMVILGGFEGFFQMLTIYFWTVFVLGGGLILWAYTNKLRFRGKVRRTNKNNVTAVDIAGFFKVDEKSQRQWQNEKNLTIAITQDNQITVTTNN